MASKKIIVEKISPSELFRYDDFIARAKYKSYSQFAEIPGKALNDLFFEELEGTKNSALTVFMAMSQSRPVGLLSLHKLNWDTEHFGMPMGKIRHILGGVDENLDFAAKKMLLKAAHEQFRKMQIRHISVRLSADDFNAILALEQARYYLADTIVEYYFDFKRKNIPEISHLCQLRLYQDSDYELIKKSVKNMFEGYIDRFHRDPYLDQQKSTELYEQWMLNSCKGLTDDCILAAIDGKLAGVSTVETYHKINKILPVSIGEIILSGVVADFRGKRVYTSMINFGQEYFKDKVNLLRVATQLNNFYVQKAWVELGFFLKYAFHTYHYYFQGVGK